MLILNISIIQCSQDAKTGLKNEIRLLQCSFLHEYARSHRGGLGRLRLGLDAFNKMNKIVQLNFIKVLSNANAKLYCVLVKTAGQQTQYCHCHWVSGENMLK